jgi:hypothetical protein
MLEQIMRSLGQATNPIDAIDPIDPITTKVGSFCDAQNSMSDARLEFKHCGLQQSGLVWFDQPG